MRLITCPECKSTKVRNKAGTYDGEFVCENDHAWDVADGRKHELGGAINLIAGMWDFDVQVGDDSSVQKVVSVRLTGRTMIEALRLQLAKHYATDDVVIISGRRFNN
jgi:hypothetical protein